MEKPAGFPGGPRTRTSARTASSRTRKLASLRSRASSAGRISRCASRQPSYQICASGLISLSSALRTFMAFPDESTAPAAVCSAGCSRQQLIAKQPLGPEDAGLYCRHLLAKRQGDLGVGQLPVIVEDQKDAIFARQAPEGLADVFFVLPAQHTRKRRTLEALGQRVALDSVRRAVAFHLGLSQLVDAMPPGDFR